MQTVFPVIMAGGSGTRLWPLSRSRYPKQFLPLTGENSMLQETIQRSKIFAHEKALFLCNENHRFLVAEQLRDFNHGDAKIILEPAGRNTAPAIALAALQIMESDGDGIMMVMAADHVINDGEAFNSSASNALSHARDGKLVTFGIVPQKPETGYGYIKRGSALDEQAYHVESFVEKPDLPKAQKYLDSGAYYWNSGMFMFKASCYLEALAAHAPEVLQACQSAFTGKTIDLDFIRVGRDDFLSSPNESIDYAVMEKTHAAVVVPMDANWCDIGSWAALWDNSDKDECGNCATGDTLLHGTKNSYISSSSRLVATVGVENAIIVETPDAVLVADRNDVQNVKEIVNQLKSADRSEHIFHRKVFRPWGSFDSIGKGERYQVKNITVKPGAKLSVQMHHHRAEHWVVVAGTAKVTKGEETILLTENQSIYIPVGIVHALENPGKIDLELIEVQSGTYLGEDDIVRLEDKYGRIQ